MNEIINDFSIRIASVNGTGSQSSNNIIFKTLFRMGIPASAKNLFPSNIKGSPTWYQVRISPKGYQSYKETSEIAVWMNPKTLMEDINCTPHGGVIIYNADELDATPIKKRKDLILYPMPITKLTKEKVEKAMLRPLLANMLYVGAIAEIFGLDMPTLEEVVRDTFKQKESVVNINLDVIHTGAQYAKEHFSKQDPYRIQAQQPDSHKITIDGNTATALGALFGGCSFLAWYPITPSSSIAESLVDYWKQYCHDKDGKAQYAVVQAEDEMAALGMVMGASWTGARAMTASSGPGISLMSEFAGYGYFSETPAVVIDVQRLGPSTGLPTRTQQGDLTFVATLGHGDTKQVMLFPATPVECFQLMQEAFNYAEEFQTPIFVMTDLDIGMNIWISEDLPYPTEPMRRGKVLTKADFEKGAKFVRYADIDGDGITYRTLPNTPANGSAYFTRGSGHTENAGYSESPEVYERLMDRLTKKYKTIESKLVKPIIQDNKKAKDGIICIGSSQFALDESLDQLENEGIQLKTCRPLAYPFNDEIAQFIAGCHQVFVVDQNRDCQLLQLLTQRFPKFHDHFVCIRYNTGLPIPAKAITRQVLKAYGKSHAAYDYVAVKVVEAD